MKTSSASAVSNQLTGSKYFSTLPPWQSLLATLNWRPVYDIEQESERLRVRSLESEKRLLESEKRLKQLQESNVRIARFEQELFSSSNPTPSTGDSSPT